MIISLLFFLNFFFSVEWKLVHLKKFVLSIDIRLEFWEHYHRRRQLAPAKVRRHDQESVRQKPATRFSSAPYPWSLYAPHSYTSHCSSSTLSTNFFKKNYHKKELTFEISTVIWLAMMTTIPESSYSNVDPFVILECLKSVYFISNQECDSAEISVRWSSEEQIEFWTRRIKDDLHQTFFQCLTM